MKPMLFLLTLTSSSSNCLLVMEYYKKPKFFFSPETSEEIRQLCSVRTPRGPQGVLLLSKYENATLNIMGHIPGAAGELTQRYIYSNRGPYKPRNCTHTLADVS